MLAANLFDHPVILIVIAAVTLLRWIAQRAKPEKGNSEMPPRARPSQPIPRGSETQTEEERIRRFLEALGQPRGTTPPAPVAPRRREVVQPRIYPRLPPLTTAPPPLPQAPVITKSPPPPLPIEAATSRASVLPIETRPTVSASQELLVKLGSIQDLRSAIVLREIFGPPRSLQPIDHVT
jgi:hypothetical protein